MFLADNADFICDFISCLRHADGDWYGKPFQLLPWQERILRDFYGTVKENGLRQYQYLYLEVPKKNGKSELAAPLGLYHTFADGEMRGEVYVCAADKDNASIVFNVAVSMLEQCPSLCKRAHIRRSQRIIEDTVSGTIMKVMSSDAFSKHGYKPSCVIFDELHAQPNRELWDVMTFGAGSSRAQPVWIILTTAGDDPDRTSIGWEVHEKARRIRDFRAGCIEGNYDNPVWYPVIYGLPDTESEAAAVDIYDETVWAACNPSLGVTISYETLRQEALDAKQNQATERLFRWLRLNQWIALKTVGWLPLTLFDRSVWQSPPDLRGKKCYGGLDLSSTTDLTAFVLLFPPQEGVSKWTILWKAWITDEKIREREKRDKVPFQQWAENGFVSVSIGNTIDFDMVFADIMQAAGQYALHSLGTDPYLSRMLTQQLLQKGVNVLEIPQNMVTMSPAMKFYERQLLEDKIAHDANPCARWCFGNVKCAVDGNENIKPIKDRSVGRIDITVATINAFATADLDQTVDLNGKILSSDWSM